MGSARPAYLSRIHSERPGITEQLATRCTSPTAGSSHVNPYERCAEAVGDHVFESAFVSMAPQVFLPFRRCMSELGRILIRRLVIERIHAAARAPS